MQKASVLAVVGPTASGKSALADRAAAALGSPVVSADAMQVYRGMDIGTAKTPASERLAPLLCVDLADVGEPFSVALYAEAARPQIDRVVASGRTAVVCGGTGLYVRAALEDMEFPPGEQRSNPARERYERMAAEMGPEAFHARLAEADPQSAALIHPNNVRRVVRAFELLEQGTSYAREHATLHERSDRHPTLRVGLSLERSELYRRIDARVDEMVARGLLDEVARLMGEGLAESATAGQAIGYKELVGVVRGERALDDAVAEVKRASRRYAKRQLTWFKADKRVVWLDADGKGADELLAEVMGLMAAGQGVAKEA